MANQIQAYILLDECINSYLDRSEQGINKYYKCWNIAYDAMTQLGLDFFATIRSIKIPINGNKTVNLPADYLNYVKIGVLNDRGEVIPLSYNDKLTLFADQLPDRKGKTEDHTLTDWYFWNTPIFYNFWDGDTFSNIYGLPSGAPFVGTFKIDPAAGIILLDEHFSYPYLIIEYVSAPAVGVECRVPIQFKEAIVAYMGWKDIEFMPNSRKGGGGDKEQRKRNYYNERRLALARYKPFRAEDAYEQNLLNQRLSVKA
jgi:hypothetical protein